MRSVVVSAWLLLCSQLAACELIADFDRGKLDQTDGAVGTPDGGVDDDAATAE